MKKIKKTTTRKTSAKKTILKKKTAKKTLKAGAPSKAKIQVKAKSAVKRKVAKKNRIISPEDLLVDSITAREGRRNVIPEGAEGNNRANMNKLNHPNKAAYRKVAGKKPVFPRDHSA